MNVNLFGEYILTSHDIARKLIDTPSEEYTLTFKEKTKSGFTLMTGEGIYADIKPGYHGTKGIYAIWRDGHCLYVGQTGASIGTRLSRFVKEVYRNSRTDEGHPAATKYRSMWGSNLDGVTVTVYPMKPQPNMNYEEVETCMIGILKPLLNSKRKK